MKKLIFLAAFLASTVGALAQETYRADPGTRVTLQGKLVHTRDGYVLQLESPIICDGVGGKETLSRVFIGVTTTAKFPQLKPYTGKHVKLSGVLDDPRGTCVLAEPQIQP
jgi:hypothetical protein